MYNQNDDLHDVISSSLRVIFLSCFHVFVYCSLDFIRFYTNAEALAAVRFGLVGSIHYLFMCCVLNAVLHLRCDCFEIYH